jgi:hypothetical protein
MKLTLRHLLPFLFFTGLGWVFVRIGMGVLFHQP